MLAGVTQEDFTDNKTNKQLVVLARHQLRGSWRPFIRQQRKHRVQVKRGKRGTSVLQHRVWTFSCLGMYELLADGTYSGVSFTPTVQQVTHRQSQEMALRFENTGRTVDTTQHVVARENVLSLQARGGADIDGIV